MKRSNSIVIAVCTGTSKLFPLVYAHYDAKNKNSHPIVAVCSTIIRSRVTKKKFEEAVSRQFPKAKFWMRVAYSHVISVIYKFLPPWQRPRFRRAASIWFDTLKIIKAEVFVKPMFFFVSISSSRFINETYGIFWLI